MNRTIINGWSMTLLLQLIQEIHAAHTAGYSISNDVTISIMNEIKLHKEVHKLNFTLFNMAHTKTHPDCDIYNTWFYV